MNQSKRKTSLIEASINTCSGFVISVIVAYFAMPLWGFSPSVFDSIGFTAMFTLISVARSYFWRRLFVRLHELGGY